MTRKQESLFDSLDDAVAETSSLAVGSVVLPTGQGFIEGVLSEADVARAALDYQPQETPQETQPEPPDDGEGQGVLFEMPPGWTEHWDGLPDFTQKDARPHDAITVQFRNDEDRRAFLVLLGERPDRRKSIWYPKMEYLKQSEVNAAPTSVPPGQYPIYVISKGRWESRLTVKALEKLGLPHYVVVEPQEQSAYAAVMDPGTLLVLPFSNLG